MNWSSWEAFWAMGGYGLYVWGSFGVTALCTNRDLPLFMSVGNGKTDFTLADSAPVLMPVTSVKAGRLPASVQPQAKPAPKAPFSPPPEKAMMCPSGSRSRGPSSMALARGQGSGGPRP